MYPNRENDYRLRVNQIMAAGGDGVRTAATAALNSNFDGQGHRLPPRGPVRGPYPGERAGRDQQSSGPEPPRGQGGPRRPIEPSTPCLPRRPIGVRSSSRSTCSRHVAATPKPPPTRRPSTALLARADEAARALATTRTRPRPPLRKPMPRTRKRCTGRTSPAGWARQADDFAAAREVTRNSAEASADKAAASARTAKAAEARAHRDAASATRFANQAAAPPSRRGRARARPTAMPIRRRSRPPPPGRARPRPTRRPTTRWRTRSTSTRPRRSSGSGTRPRPGRPHRASPTRCARSAGQRSRAALHASRVQ